MRAGPTLTLNSHSPVARDTSLERNLDCGSLLGVEDDEDVCRLNKLFLGLFEAIADIAAHTKGGVHVIIVGDHAPSFLWGADRRVFKPGVVPFVELVPKVSDGLADTH
jgi:hypothetical protein